MDGWGGPITALVILLVIVGAVEIAARRRGGK